ncbi:MAG: tRNA dihydrouridine(20/20a) synthase DusA [Nitratireductor sp.]
MYEKALKENSKIFSVAPMIDWTDRHCRFFHRQLTRRALLYTEMIVADAAIHGDRDKLLGNSQTPSDTSPVALQLGGSDPLKLSEAAKIGAGYGYQEINLNVGCPSDRVQSGAFGACLMRDPDLVASCVEAMSKAVDLPVTVKCRIGVDDQTPEQVLPDFAKKVWNAGSKALWVHARKAWLEGLSPKENRNIPPLDYDIVHVLKRENPQQFIGLNGGVENVIQAKALIENTPALDGAMLGRASYQSPDILWDVDALFYDAPTITPDYDALIDAMAEYAQKHVEAGGKLHHVTRHMVGLFGGKMGSRRWRQILSVEATKMGATSQVLKDAYAAVNLTPVAQDVANLAAHISD